MAFGTERGIVGLFANIEAELRLLERGTGRVLEILATIDLSGGTGGGPARTSRSASAAVVGSLSRHRDDSTD